MAAFPGPKSVVTSMAGFAGGFPPQPAARTATPAARRYSPAVSRRMPVSRSIRRRDHPSRPNAMTCCFLSSLKTLAMLTEATKLPARVNVLGGLYMAGFEVSLHGRFWVAAKDLTNGHIRFRWWDSKDSNRFRVMALDAIEFIRRFLLHVLPPRFVNIQGFSIPRQPQPLANPRPLPPTPAGCRSQSTHPGDSH